MASKKDNLPQTVENDMEPGSSITYANEVVAIIAGVALLLVLSFIVGSVTNAIKKKSLNDELNRRESLNASQAADEAEKEYDVIIFDFPAGMDFSLYTCLPDGTLFLTVAVPDPVSVRDAAAVSERLSEISCISRLIVNNFKYRLVKRGIFRNIDDIIDSAGLRLLGVVPSSEELAFLSVTHRLKPSGKPMRAFKRIAERLCGENILLPQPKKI